MQVLWVRNIVDSSLTSEILKNLIYDQKRLTEDFILKTIIGHETGFLIFVVGK